MEIPDELIQSLLPAIDQQMESKDTPFVKSAYDRLVTKCGVEDEEAKELLAQALAITSNRMVTSGKPFDLGYYKELLQQLPALPDESA